MGHALLVDLRVLMSGVAGGRVMLVLVSVSHGFHLLVEPSPQELTCLRDRITVVCTLEQ